MIPATHGSYGVVVGRFQVHQLHAGHRFLIEYALTRHQQVLVVIGTSATRGGRNNPLDFNTRYQMLDETFGGRVIGIRPLHDQPSDEVWSENLDTLVNEYTLGREAFLYGSRDSFLKSYVGRHTGVEVEEFPSISGTLIRKALGKAPQCGESFRAGVIYSTQNRYPISYQAVDIAIVDAPEIGGYFQVLLGRKPGETMWRFPGGFVDPTDPSLEAAAIREAKEETSLDVTAPAYLGSFRVDDWRYRSEVDKIMTAFFVTVGNPGLEKASDDLEEVRWFTSNDLLRHVTPSHLALAWRLIGASVNASKGLAL